MRISARPGEATRNSVVAVADLLRPVGVREADDGQRRRTARRRLPGLGDGQAGRDLDGLETEAGRDEAELGDDAEGLPVDVAGDGQAAVTVDERRRPRGRRRASPRRGSAG